MNEWPGRRRAEELRQWPVLRETIDRVSRLDAFDGVIALGSFADGEPDELSDLDLLAVAAPGRFEEAWASRGDDARRADRLEALGAEERGSRGATRRVSGAYALTM